MNLKALTNLINKVLRSVKYGDAPRPVRDWYVMVLTTMVLLAVSAGWSYWLFEKTSTTDFAGKAAAKVTQVQTVSVDTVKNIFAMRATERTHYQTDYHFVDPSR